MLMTVDKFLWCVELRTACLIIGYFNLTVEIVTITLCFMGMFTGGWIIDDDTPDDWFIGGFMVAGSIIMMLVMLISVVFTCLLLAGIHQNKRDYVTIYIIYVTILLVLGIICWLAQFAWPDVGIASAVGKFIGLLWCTYSPMVVRSYYFKMADPPTQPLHNEA